MRGLFLAAAAVAASMVSAWAGAAAPPAPLYLAPGASDTSRCTRSAPCASFDRAYHVARPGQQVLLAAGTYPRQDISADASKRSPADVVFLPAPGAKVVVADLNVKAQHLEIRGVRINEFWTTDVSVVDVTFRNVVAPGFIISSSRNVRVLGGSYGPSVDDKPQVAAWPDDIEPRDILIDGVSFHDMTRSDGAVHTECLQFGAGNGLVVRNSRFRHCDIMNIHFGHWGSTPDPRNIVVENNFFSTSTDAAGNETYYSLMLRGAWSNSLIRNNSATQPMIVNVYGGGGKNIRMVGNVAPADKCDSRVTYSHNVWLGRKCGPTDKSVSSLGFVDASKLDLHLRPGSPAVGAGDPKNFPARDIDGQRRPAGLPEAGADELR
ncbi:MAG TPA: choice-of-anchor Q domain-containing protein [Gaiellaceae bacterium]